MFITTATNRIIGVTRKCFKDSELPDVVGVPVEASSLALTSVLSRENAHSLAGCCFVQSHRGPGSGPHSYWSSARRGWARDTQQEDETQATALLGVFVGTHDVWGRS